MNERSFNEEIQTRVLIALRKIIRSIDRHSRMLIKTSGLTVPQILILQEIAASADSTVSKLAKSVSLSQPTVKDIVDRLLDHGLLRREPSGNDKRSNILDITDAGNRILASKPSLLHNTFLESFGELAEWEKTQILATLQRLASLMASESIPEAPILYKESDIDEVESDPYCR